MQILSFDSSSSSVQIALSKNERVVYEQRIKPVQSQRSESASTLLPAIDKALKSCSWSKKDLDFLVVGTGPGSFTGVRVAVITARSIAQGLGLGLMGISSLETIAFACRKPCAVVLAAGRGKYYAGAFHNDRELVKAFFADEPELLRLRLGKLDSWVLAAGIETNICHAKEILPYPEDINLAGSQAELAYLRLSCLQKKDARSLENRYPWDNVLPLYLQNASVTLKANGSSNKKVNRS